MPLVEQGLDVNSRLKDLEIQAIKALHRKGIYLKKDGFYHVMWKDIHDDVESFLYCLIKDCGYTIICVYDDEKDYYNNHDIQSNCPWKFANFNWGTTQSTWGYIIAPPEEGKEMYKPLTNERVDYIKEFLLEDALANQDNDWKRKYLNFVMPFIENGISWEEYKENFVVQRLFDFLLYSNAITVPLYITIEDRLIPESQGFISNVMLVEENL